MTAPQTGIEATGEWMTLADEPAFLSQIAADHADVTVTEVDRTAVYDYPLNKVVLDRAPAGAPTVMFVGGVHGNEPAGREITLQALRDLAYSTEPAIVSLLSQVRFVFLPTVNPTGRHRNQRMVYISLDPAVLVDPNREYLIATLAETRLVQQAVTDYSPCVVIDYHEYLAPDGTRVTAETLPTTNPNVHPAIKGLIDDLEASIWAGWDAEGIPYKRYGALSPNPQTGWNSGALRHAVTITPETPAHPNAAVPPAERMRMMQAVLDVTLGWIDVNLATIVAASSASRAAAVTRGQTGQPAFVMESGTVLDPAPHGYEALSAWPPILDILGATGDAGFVPLGQDEGTVLPYILDAGAAEPQAVTQRVPIPIPQPAPKMYGPLRRVGVVAEGGVRAASSGSVLTPGGWLPIPLPGD